MAVQSRPSQSVYPILNHPEPLEETRTTMPTTSPAPEGMRADRELWDERLQQSSDGVARSAEGLRAEWERVFVEPIAFYRDKYSAAGLGVGDFRELDDIPLTRKHELRSNEEAIPPFGTHRTVG